MSELLVTVSTNYPITPRGILTQRALREGSIELLNLLVAKVGLPPLTPEDFDSVIEIHKLTPRTDFTENALAWVHCFVSTLPGEVKLLSWDVK